MVVGSTSATQMSQVSAPLPLPVSAPLSSYNNYYTAPPAPVQAVAPPPPVEASHYARQRPLQEIVSSMQGGSFNFLQESQIDIDSNMLILLPVFIWN